MGEKFLQARIPLGIEDRRGGKRRQIYIGEGLHALIQYKSKEICMPIAELSPSGFSTSLTSSDFEQIPEVGELVDVSIQIPNQPTNVFKAMVVHRSNARFGGKVQEQIGFSYFRPPSDEVLVERRKRKRFQCPLPFQPLVFANHSVFFNEYLSFQVEEVSSEGASLRTTNEIISLMPGMRFTGRMYIPMEGETNLEFSVNDFKKEPESNLYEISVLWDKTEKDFLQKIGNYLFFNAKIALSELQFAGFDYFDTYRGLQITYPQTERDWDDILSLRYTAYKAVGKFTHVSDKTGMLDHYDQFSRQLLCKLRDKSIGSARIVFVGNDLSRSEHYSSLKLKIPEFLSRDGFVEISRACTLPEYRGGDVYTVILRHVARIVYQSGIRYLVANCNTNLWPLYKKLGFKKTGIEFEAFGTKDCNLIYCDIRKALDGSDPSFFGYNLVVLPSARFLIDRGANLGLRAKLTILLHELVHNLLKKLVHRLKSSKRKLKKSGGDS